ncbi:MAG: extracellular medium-chain-length polyhydroxyalkanoate depolymerase [Endozoicomonas sp.]
MNSWLKLTQGLLFSVLTAVSFASSAASASSSQDSRCHVTPATTNTPEKTDCDIWSLTIQGSTTGASGFPDKRDVLYSLPLGKVPKEGWPVVVFYQGSFFPTQFAGDHTTDSVDAYFGAYYELQTIKELLDNGYAVLVPRALNNIAWQTNVPNPMDPYGFYGFTITQDYKFLTNLLAAINDGQFDRHGKLNTNKLFATGISSGGYNTSRMAVSFAGQFTALAIHSASYATCNGSICSIPSTMPKDHPPTVFLHGSKDPLVPVSTMERYYNTLQKNGITTEKHVFSGKGHEWVPQSPSIIRKWFDRHK